MNQPQDKTSLVVHALLLVAVIGAVVALALFHLISGDVALGVIAPIAGIVGGSGASLVGGNLALSTPQQATPPATPPPQNPPAS